MGIRTTRRVVSSHTLAPVWSVDGCRSSTDAAAVAKRTPRQYFEYFLGANLFIVNCIPLFDCGAARFDECLAVSPPPSPPALRRREMAGT